jgi:hypothetical protein
MSKKYVIDLPDDAQYILINGASENHCYTRVEQVEDLEELNSDYINEHYGELQDEAYQKGFEDGKNQKEDSIEVGDEVKHHFQGYGVVTRIKEVNGKTHYNAVWSNGNTGYYEYDVLTKTGKHYDIASILEAMRNDKSTTRTVKA